MKLLLGMWDGDDHPERLARFLVRTEDVDVWSAAGEDEKHEDINELFRVS
jgi:hypothetical protein